MKLPLSEVRNDPEVQLRSGSLDMERVEAMIEFEKEGGHLPAITVVGARNLLGDGHHRLYAAMTSGKKTIEANRIVGDFAEAVVTAIINNDIATTKPLTRTERNKGIKLLLKAGWSHQKIADATHIHRTTIENILNSLAMRGEITKKTSGKGTPKPVAVLPTAVAEELNDTILARIADGVAVEDQVEFAEAIVKHRLPEPRVREAIKEIKGGMTPTEAVEEVRSHAVPMPKTLPQVFKAVTKRIKDFTDTTMVIDGRTLDLWEVLDALAATRTDDDFDPWINGVYLALTELSTKLDAQAVRFAPAPVLLAVEA